MTVVSNDPTWWPAISAYNFSSYFAVAAFVGVTYDWALTFGQEVELVWRQRWSLMTVLYLSVRYLGILSAALFMVGNVPTISLTDTAGWHTLYSVWMGVVAFAMLWVIIITRLHAMYQRDRKILIFLVVTFLAINIFDVVTTLMSTIHISVEELILSGTYQCRIGYAGDTLVLGSVAWIFTIVWEVLSTMSRRGIIGDCFTMLMKTHVLYFVSFVTVSCFELILCFSPTDQNVVESDTFYGLLQIFSVVQMFVLGPRLILGVREYNAKLVANSDAASRMTSIAFQELLAGSTGN
ncbi:uncharacterized protein F5147DRAFT_840412 [Suillus discolor]|uniref:DUF6533 domain-containing protein n=1 Tax=Suillus discolor TaxID=1912936 RepID=A0A9P7EXC5_9AGAM|nr:uncharacterized protein F5147DRAFT_840412 [Suillus discolor]KAG2093895.1 hypothetical protein F5147DRAFT_840412 [Suillus discolor]